MKAPADPGVFAYQDALLMEMPGTNGFIASTFIRSPPLVN